MKKTHQKTVYSGKWTKAIVADWEHNGHRGVWEYVERNDAQQGVVIIPIDAKKKTVLLIRQRRIPIDGYVIEFPAGLVDKGESAEECIMRELYEETGAHGKLLHLTEPLATSPGLTSECVLCAIVAVTTREKNAPDISEEIECLEIEFDSLADFLDNASKSAVIDSKVWFFTQMFTHLFDLRLDDTP